MLLKYFYDKSLSQASYLVACETTRQALVVDPARDIRPYLQVAREENLRITHVAETHIHADFASGGRELAFATGARLYLSALGGPDWLYHTDDCDAVLLNDGDQIDVGTIRIDVLHTPGHTPEHLAYRVTDTTKADQPIGIFSGDFLFVGDVGRPDLDDSAETSARQQFANLQRFREMPDYLQIWPGHGAGSLCGKALGSLPSTTLGYEKRFNPAFQIEDETRFVAWLLSGQPETPRYFAHLKQVNRQGVRLLRDLEPRQRLEGFILSDVLRAGSLVIDTRSAEEYRAGHVPGTLSLPQTDKFAVYAGEFVRYDRPTYLIALPEDVNGLLRDLRAIGVDDIPGYFPPDELGNNLTTLDTITPHETAAQSDSIYLLDVRSAREYGDEYIVGAHHIPLGEVADRLADIPQDQQIVVQCSSGERANIIASLLQNQGYPRVANLEGGLDAWKAAGLPVVSA